MPRSKEGVKRQKVSVEGLEGAIKLVHETGVSVRTAAKQCGVSRTTLQRHLDLHIQSGDTEFLYKNNCSINQVFSKEEEQSLRDYLLTASSMHYGLTKEDVKKLAYQFAKANGKKYPGSWDVNCQAGEQWLVDFRKRNPALSLRTPRPTSIARATGFNKPIVQMFFDKYASVLEKHKFTPERVYNMDETGVSSVHTPPKVLASRKLKQVGGITSTERGFNTTMIACINALGNAIPPVFVFPRVNFKSHMLHGAPPGSYGTCHISGWSNSDVFLEFLRHFIKHVKPDNDKNKVILIMDNHESHISVEAIDLARDNGIVMLTIPPHTSHKLQPLDRGVFGPFKTYYNDACKSWFLTNPGKPLTIYDVAGICGKAYPLAFTPSNIMAGFSSSGVWPFNRNVFADHEYSASLVSERPYVDSSEAPSNTSQRPTNEGPAKVGLHTASDELFLTNSELVDDPELFPGTSNATPGPSNELDPIPGCSHSKVSVQVSRTSESTPKDKSVTIPSPRSLEEIRPFPKVERKKPTIKGRKPGRCRVLTDTPEKNEIAAEAEQRKKKLGQKKQQKLKEKKIRATLFDDGTKKRKISHLKPNESKKKIKTKKKIKLERSSSEESLASFLSGESEIGIEEFIKESEDKDEIFDPNKEPIKNQINKWVLVSFKTKGTIKHYVGLITNVVEGFPIVKFARRIKKSSVFVWPKEDDEGEIQKDDIAVFLPTPAVGRRGQYSFPVSFSGFNVY